MGLKVLVGEDNEFNFEVLEEFLGSRGHAVAWAHDGEEVLETVRKGKFDLLLLDLHMPKLDGMQVMRALRSQQPADPLKVIVLSGDVMAGVPEAIVKAGADAFLSKPIDLLELDAQITKLTGIACAVGQSRLGRLDERS